MIFSTASEQASSFKQISDKVSMVGNQSSKQRTVYDSIRKAYRDNGKADISDLDTLEASATETMILSAELIRAIQTARGLIQ